MECAACKVDIVMSHLVNIVCILLSMHLRLTVRSRLPIVAVACADFNSGCCFFFSACGCSSGRACCCGSLRGRLFDVAAAVADCAVGCSLPLPYGCRSCPLLTDACLVLLLWPLSVGAAALAMPNATRLSLEGAREALGMCPGNDREVPGRCPGGAREASGRRPGGVREASGRRPGGVREASGRRPGGVREASGRRPGMRRESA